MRSPLFTPPYRGTRTNDVITSLNISPDDISALARVAPLASAYYFSDLSAKQVDFLSGGGARANFIYIDVFWFGFHLIVNYNASRLRRYQGRPVALLSHREDDKKRKKKSSPNGPRGLVLSSSSCASLITERRKKSQSRARRSSRLPWIVNRTEGGRGDGRWRDTKTTVDVVVVVSSVKAFAILRVENCRNFGSTLFSSKRTRRIFRDIWNARQVRESKSTVRQISGVESENVYDMNFQFLFYFHSTDKLVEFSYAAGRIAWDERTRRNYASHVLLVFYFRFRLLRLENHPTSATWS